MMSSFLSGMLKVGKTAGPAVARTVRTATPRPRMATTVSAVMTKKDLVAAVAEKSGLEQKQAELAVAAAVDTIVEAVARGEKVEIKGFGSFQPRHLAARTGRNPSTGESLQIPESATGSFTIGKTFKDRVKEGHKKK